MIYIRASHIKDIPHVASNMREDDRRDVLASSNSSPENALTRGLAYSKPLCYSVMRGNYPTESIETDIDYIAPRMREADLREIKAVGVPDPYEALKSSYYGSKPKCYTAIGCGVPVAMMGVVPDQHNPKWGSIWLLGTDDVTDVVSIPFLKWSKKFLPIMIEPYDLVYNRVDKRNEVHVKWIKWLGFTFIREVTHGPENLPFYEFARMNHV